MRNFTYEPQEELSLRDDIKLEGANEGAWVLKMRVKSNAAILSKLGEKIVLL